MRCALISVKMPPKKEVSHKISNTEKASTFEKYLNIEHCVAGTGGRMCLGWLVEVPRFILLLKPELSTKINSAKSVISQFILIKFY